jgi:membrane-associated protein
VTLSHVLIAHGSALILPLAVIEGPIVTIVTGFLAAQGYFAWYWSLFLLICGDLIGDIIYYWIGRAPLGFLRRLAGKRGVVTASFQARLRHSSTRMLLIGKWTHSAGCLVLIGSGMLRLPLARFMLINLIATVPKSTVLFSLGYFFGDHYPLLERHWILGVCLAGGLGVACFVLILRRSDRIMAVR